MAQRRQQTGRGFEVHIYQPEGQIFGQEQPDPNVQMRYVDITEGHERHQPSYKPDVRTFDEWRLYYQQRGINITNPLESEYQYFGPFLRYFGENDPRNEETFILTYSDYTTTHSTQTFAQSAFPSTGQLLHVDGGQVVYIPVYGGEVTDGDGDIDEDKVVPLGQQLFSQGVIERYNSFKRELNGYYDERLGDLPVYSKIDNQTGVESRIYLHHYYEKLRSAELRAFNQLQGLDI